MERSKFAVVLLMVALIMLATGAFVVLPQLIGNGVAVTSTTTRPTWQSRRPMASPDPTGPLDGRTDQLRGH